MKIAFLVYNFPPNQLSGTGIATYNIAKHLVLQGHEIHVVTVSEGPREEGEEQGFFVHRLPKRGFGTASTFFYWIQVSRMLANVKPDIISVQSIPLGIPGLISKIFLSVPCVVWGRGSDIYLRSKRKNLISKIVLRNADAVIALTEDMKRKMADIFERNIFVIPNGIDLDRFKGLSAEKCRADLKIEYDEKIIVAVGRLHPIKGHKYLIESMKIVSEKHKQVRLILVGDGSERANLQILAKQLDLEDRVQFVGEIKNDEVLNYLMASDIFVLPSLSEGFAIVNLEAMASGLPIVASKVGGVPEIIREGVNGLLVEPGSSKEIAEKVIILLEDDQLRQRISKNNIERSREYGWDKVANELDTIYKLVAKH